MMMDEVCLATNRSEMPKKRATRKHRQRSRFKLYVRRIRKRCKKAGIWILEAWDWLGSPEKIERVVIEVLRRILGLKYLLSSLLLLMAMVATIHILLTSGK